MATLRVVVVEHDAIRMGVQLTPMGDIITEHHPSSAGVRIGNNEMSLESVQRTMKSGSG
jgi:hypothetical protein